MHADAMWRVLDGERARVAGLLESLSAADWAHPSLCAGWTVRDVAAHLTLGPRTGVWTAMVEFARARGSFDRMVDSTARRQAARRPTVELVTELRAIVRSRLLAPGQKLADAMMDVLVHGQDIAIPLGRQRDMPLQPARASADHLWSIGYPFHAARPLAGFRLVAVDVDWAVGEGAEVRGPVSALLLLAGRTATVPQLTGPGAAALSGRSPAR